MVNFFLGGGVVVQCRGVIKEKSPDFRFPEVGISAYPVLLSSEEKRALQALLQPIIFGEKLAERMIEVNVITNPKLLTHARGDYEKLFKSRTGYNRPSP